jgi:ascorbate-specific PTS system EIIC-type component UlaA
MGNIGFLVIFIGFGLLSMLEPFIQRRNKGFYIDSIIYVVLSLAIITSISFQSSLNPGFNVIIIIVVFMAFLLILKAYTTGNRIIFKTGCSNYGIQDKLVEALDENNIKYEINNSEANNTIIIKKYICSITIKTSSFNSDRKTVSFWGWWSYRKYLKVRNAFIHKMKGNVIVTNTEQRYPIIGGILFIVTGVLLYCFL